MKKYIIAILAALLMTSAVFAAPGDLLGTVDLPGNGGLSVAGTFDGMYYITVDGPSDQIDIFLPPVGGNSSATLVATKTVQNGAGAPVAVSALAWDPTRNMIWGAYGDAVVLIDLQDKSVSSTALATLAFAPGVGGYSLIDGLAYDASDDTIYLSPDVDCYVYHFAPDGTLLDTIAPKDDIGVEDCDVSGVVVGSANTLYIGRNGNAEIRRIDKTTGNFISTFATTSGRDEDLTCDPVTYAPLEAILSKDAYGAYYEAFEVEAGTCPLQGQQEEGCTYTQGYWKTHSEEGPATPPDETWDDLASGPDTPFYSSGQSWYEVFWTSPKGNAYYQLAHQYMAAKLNILSGAVAPSEVTDAISDAETLFGTYSSDTVGDWKGNQGDRKDFIMYAGILGDYNEGIIGPGHCDDEEQAY